MKPKIYIKRAIEDKIKEKLFKGKALIIIGPRQSGKTTLVKQIIRDRDDFIWFNADEPDIRDLFFKVTSIKLKKLFGDKKIVCIDEAQRIDNIGIVIKLIVDEIPDVQPVITGSSALELMRGVFEPLTGRHYIFYLLPFSFLELATHYSMLEEKRCLEDRLLFGSYPEIVLRTNERIEHLKLLADSYLFKDLLGYEGIKKPMFLEKIVKAIALQVGSEVSFNEIARLVGTDNKTVERYIHLLEQTFVLFQLPALSRNMRNEIKKGKKIYFWDNGVRNALIGNFLPLHSRNDVGALWENYVIAERLKLLKNCGLPTAHFFWRTKQQQEIDYIEEISGKLKAYEIKFSKDVQRTKIPKTFLNLYPDSSTDIITQANYSEFLVNVQAG